MGGGAQPALAMGTLPLLLLSLWAVADAASNPTLENKCGGEIAKLTECLPYVTGQAAAPTDKCCGAASDNRGKDPACICYVIRQTYEGRAVMKELGLQLGRLLQLPTVCRLPNSNVTDCPKLLDTKPSSPDYAIFNSSVASSNTPAGPSSAGFMNRVRYPCAMVSSVASAVVFFPVLFSS